MKNTTEENKSGGTIPQDILEFLKTARTLSNQIEILKHLELPPEQMTVAKNAVRLLVKKVSLYVEEAVV